MSAPSFAFSGRRDHLDLLPVAVVHIDPIGTIKFGNRMFTEMVGVPGQDLPGRNMLEFGADDPARYVELLSFSSLVTAEIMGPVAGTYHAADGTIRRTNMWSRNMLEDPEVDAIVCVFTPEETRDTVADALSSIVSGATVDHTLELLAASVRGHPFDCTGCWLLREGDETRIVAPAHFDPRVRAVLEGPGPWWPAVSDRWLHECCDTATEADGTGLRAEGIAAWWLLPVTGIPDTRIGLLVLRRLTGPPSPNQVEHLQEMITIARLAVDQDLLRTHLAHAAFHDPLTGLANRSRFFGRDDLTTRAGAAVFTIDLDRFKPVNDLHGHRIGDRALMVAAERIRRVVRPDDHVARFGGDEFVVECTGLESAAKATEIAARLVSALSEPMQLDGIDVQIGASVGVAWQADGAHRAELLERSDQALIKAKQAGRGRWQLAD